MSVLNLIVQPRYLDGADWINAIPAKTQIFYSFLRSDNNTTWDDSILNPGTLRYNSSGDDTADYTVNDVIFVDDPIDPHIYHKVSTVKTAPIFAAGRTKFDVDLPFVQVIGNGTCNNLTTKTNYRGEFQIWDAANTLKLIDETFIFIPQQDGDLKVDLSEIGLFLLRKDDIRSLEITLRHRGIWNEDETAAWINNNKIQIIAADVSREESTTAMLVWTPDDNTKKWLTRFTSGADNAQEISMKLTRGWRHYMYFIVDEDFNGRTGGNPQIKEHEFDINRVNIGLLLGPVAVSTLVAVFEYTIVNNNNSSAHLLIELEESFGGAKALEDFFIRNTDESEQPIMLHWLNELGGWDQWLFNMNQQVTETVTEGAKTLAFSWDQFHLQRDRKISRLNLVLNQRIEITAKNLSANQFDVLRYLARSDDVQVFLEKNDSENTGVLIVPDTLTWETKEKLFDLTLTIEFAPGFDFFKEKGY